MIQVWRKVEVKLENQENITKPTMWILKTKEKSLIFLLFFFFSHIIVVFFILPICRRQWLSEESEDSNLKDWLNQMCFLLLHIL